MAAEILHEVTAGRAAEQTGSVGGGGGGGYLFARAEESERIDEAVVDMLFDIDPRDPVVIAILVAVACVVVAVVWFGVNARGKSRVRWAPDPAGGDGSGDSGSDDGGGKGNSRPSPSPVVQRRHNTRGHRITTPGSSGGSSSSRASSPTSRQFRAEATKTVGLTLKQLQLCEVLYDLHAGVVPLRGIKSRAVRDCELSVSVGVASLLQLSVGVDTCGLLLILAGNNCGRGFSLVSLSSSKFPDAENKKETDGMMLFRVVHARSLALSAKSGNVATVFVWVIWSRDGEYVPLLCTLR